MAPTVTRLVRRGAGAAALLLLVACLQGCEPGKSERVVATPRRDAGLVHAELLARADDGAELADAVRAALLGADAALAQSLAGRLAIGATSSTSDTERARAMRVLNQMWTRAGLDWHPTEASRAAFKSALRAAACDSSEAVRIDGRVLDMGLADPARDDANERTRLLLAIEVAAMLLVVVIGIYPSLFTILALPCLPGIPMAAWGLWRPAAFRRRRKMRIYVHACGAAALLCVAALAVWIVAHFDDAPAP